MMVWVGGLCVPCYTGYAVFITQGMCLVCIQAHPYTRMSHPYKTACHTHTRHSKSNTTIPLLPMVVNLANTNSCSCTVIASRRAGSPSCACLCTCVCCICVGSVACAVWCGECGGSGDVCILYYIGIYITQPQYTPCTQHKHHVHNAHIYTHTHIHTYIHRQYTNTPTHIHTPLGAAHPPAVGLPQAHQVGCVTGHMSLSMQHDVLSPVSCVCVTCMCMVCICLYGVCMCITPMYGDKYTY